MNLLELESLVSDDIAGVQKEEIEEAGIETEAHFNGSDDDDDDDHGDGWNQCWRDKHICCLARTYGSSIKHS